ncbi:hypothetical protein ACTWP5_03855 [Streptomyces sp. 4N509B]|uniref:hypothetical protein n=1 Tax=Streptomyces sp. 4N509B TaxID=3457413 RepID=UPI003FD6355A
MHARIRRMLLLAAAACATAVTTQVAGAAEPAADRTDQAAEFTDCVRDHGVADFPGVTVSADGQIQLADGDSGDGFNVLDRDYREAAQACAGLLPGDAALPGRPATPAANLAGDQATAPTVPDTPFTCEGDDCPAAPELPAAPEPPVVEN